MTLEDLIKTSSEEYLNIVAYNESDDDYFLLMKYNLNNGWEYWLSPKVLNAEVTNIFIWNNELTCTLK